MSLTKNVRTFLKKIISVKKSFRQNWSPLFNKEPNWGKVTNLKGRIHYTVYTIHYSGDKVFCLLVIWPKRNGDLGLFWLVKW